MSDENGVNIAECIRDKNMSAALMPLYKSHKQLHALPMTLGTYNFVRGWKMPELENPEDEGYITCYNRGTEDEHVSWSPKHVFDEGNTEMTGGNDINAVTALYAFAGWLTSMDKPITFSANQWATPAADMVAAMIEANGITGEFNSDEIVIPSDFKFPVAVGATPELAPVSPMEELTRKLVDDEGYAWSWHCNIAMAFQDEGGSHESSNKAAARFMQNAFGIDLRGTELYKSVSLLWATEVEGDKA